MTSLRAGYAEDDETPKIDKNVNLVDEKILRKILPMKDIDTKEIVIIGAGICGLATALALRKIANLNVKIYERSETLRGGEGTALTMWPNGLAALEYIDSSLLETIKGKGTIIGRQTFDTPEKSETVDTLAFCEANGQPLMSVFWQRLHSQLAAEVGKENIILGKNCIDIKETQGSESVTLSFEDGETLETKFVLACDGIHSRVRNCVLNDGKPRDHGRIIYRSVIPYEKYPHIARDQMIGRVNRDPSLLVHWQPCGDDYTYWAVVKKPSEDYPHEMFGDENADEMKEWLLKEFDAFPEAREMIRVTDAKDILERKVLDRPPIEKWSFCNNRILLMGDAAHAMILSVGQGANTALEDAAQIGQLFQDIRAKKAIFSEDTSNSEIEEKKIIVESESSFADQMADIVKAFENIRITRCTTIQGESEGYAKQAYGSTKRTLGQYRTDWLLDFRPTSFDDCL